MGTDIENMYQTLKVDTQNAPASKSRSRGIVLSVVQQGGEALAHEREHVPHLAQRSLAVLVKHLFTIQDRGSSRTLVGLLLCNPSLE